LFDGSSPGVESIVANRIEGKMDITERLQVIKQIASKIKEKFPSSI
jgi:hypothetical protein